MRGAQTAKDGTPELKIKWMDLNSAHATWLSHAACVEKFGEALDTLLKDYEHVRLSRCVLTVAGAVGTFLAVLLPCPEPERRRWRG